MKWILFFSGLSLVIGGTAIAADGLAYDKDITEYGKECKRDVGVEVPEIDCLSPSATKLGVHRNGTEITDRAVEDCDRPAFLEKAKACVPGARLIKLTQTFNRGGKTESVTTMILCRRKRVYPPVWSAVLGRMVESNRFDDIGVIQHNESNNKTCWFYFVDTEPGAGIPAGRDLTQPKGEENSYLVPPPYTASYDAATKEGRYDRDRARFYWATPAAMKETNCQKCHNAGPWLRTPYVMQAAKDKANDNAVPENYREHPEHVGKIVADWNTTLRPKFIQVNEKGIMALYSEKDRLAYQKARSADPSTVARVNECTRCHNLGANTQAKDKDYGTCGYLLGAATGFGKDASGQKLSAWGRTFPQSHQMPPRHGMANAADWRRYYTFALGALTYCCESPNARVRVGDEVINVCSPDATGPIQMPNASARALDPPHARGGETTHSVSLPRPARPAF